MAATPPETSEAASSVGFGGGEGLAEEVADYGVLEGGYEVEGLLVAEGEGFGGFRLSGIGGERGAAGFDGGVHVVGFDVAEDGGLDAAEGEVEGRLSVRWPCCWRALIADFGFDLGEGEGDGAGVAVGGEGVDPGAAGVAEAEELGHLVVGFAGGVVYGAAYVAVVPAVSRPWCGEIEVGVAAGDDEGEERARSMWGNGALGASIRTAWMWPSRWLTAMRGLSRPKARALA